MAHAVFGLGSRQSGTAFEDDKKLTAVARLAFHADLSVVGRDYLVGDEQSQSRARLGPIPEI